MVLGILRIGFAALAVVAILAQLLDLADGSVLNPVNYFSPARQPEGRSFASSGA
jgi:hypothetical protein